MNMDHMVLCLVRMHPDVTGYQIKAIFDRSPGHIIPIHLSKIYPALKRLSDQGWVSCRTEPKKGRLDQKFYTITPTGQEELDRWLRQPYEFSASRSAFEEYLLWLGGVAYMDNETVLRMIDQGISYLEKRIAVEQDESYQSDGMAYVTPADESEVALYSKMYSEVYGYLNDETNRRLEWLRHLRTLYE